MSSLVVDARTAALEQAAQAEATLIEEYQVWRRSWETNPTIAAMKDGILAIRALRKVIEGA